MTGSRTIDADVHCAAIYDDLYAYMNDHWPEYVKTGGSFGATEPPAVNYSYPLWSPVATRRADTSLEQIQSRVLGQSSYAVLNCYFGTESLRHPFMAAVLARSVNSWLQAEWLSKDDRLFASMALTPQDTDEAVAEIERVGDDPRFVQLLLPVRAWEPYGNRRYWPIWRAAADRGLALGLHFGGLTGDASTPVGRFSTYFEHYAGATQLFKAHLTGLIASGILEECPNLRICLMESGVTWLPTLMWKLDTEWRSVRREIPWVRRAPSEYIREHVRLTVQPFDAPADAKIVSQVIDQLGSDEMLMYSSDFPHDHGTDLGVLLDVLDDEQTQRLVWENAAGCYGIEERLARTSPARV